MSSEYWRRIEALFHGALDQPAEDRESWLAEQCGDDSELFDGVRELLAADSGEETATADPARSIVNRSVVKLPYALAPSTGQTIGPWRIVRELGRGGMGYVFLAERADEEYEREVALKLIRGFPDPASLERLRTERQILAGLDHPHIAAMIDGGTTGEGQPYLVMQYIDGVPIDRWCREQQPPIRRRIEMMMRVCDAVQYAHQNLVIHRDLKPSNVLVTNAGQPMLLDFGIAKLLEPDQDGEADLTRAGRYYTPGFAAPEQMSGQPISTVSDVFSLGKLLGLLLGPGTPGSAGRVPADLEAIVRQATADASEDRYPSAASLRSDLERFLEGSPVEAAAPRLAYRFKKFLLRHRLGVSVAALVLVVSGTLVYRIVLESERAQAAEAQAVVEARNANQVLEFVIGMIEGAGPANAQGEPVTVLQAVEQASTPEALEVLDEPALRARVLSALGRLNRSLEYNQPAIALLNESARLSRELGDVAGEVEALSILGMSAVLNEDMDRGGDALQRAVELARAAPGIDPLLLAQALNNQGIYFNEIDDSEPAFARVSEALEIRRAVGAPDRTIATSLHNLGEVHDIAGQPREALNYYQQALDLKRKAVGRLHPSYANSLNGLNLAARQLGEYELARDAIEEQMAIRIELFGADQPILWRDHNELGGSYHDMGEYGKAIEHYTRAMELDARSPGGAARGWLFANNMAVAHRDWGQFDLAESLFRRSIELRTARFGADSLTTVRPYHNLASVLLASGRAGQAREALQPALERRRRELNPEHPDVLRSEALGLAIDQALGGEGDHIESMRTIIARMVEVTDEASMLVISARSLLGQTLLDQGNLTAARAELEAVAALLREQLKPDHALAVVRELDLAWIDFLEGRADAGVARLERHGQALQRQFPEDSVHRRQLDCLLDVQVDASCWRSPGA